jgi:hypothetical protein
MRIRGPHPHAALLVAVPFFAIACSGGSSATAPSSPGASAAGSAMALEVGGLQVGATVTDNVVTLQVTPKGYQVSCAEAGKPNKDGAGHYHVELDHALVNMYCTPTAAISMQNVTPGKHTLTVLPAKNDHNEIKDAAVALDFTYQPSNPLPEITAAANPGTSAITIASPASGSTVSGDFTVKVQISNFTVSGALFGKANLAGYGHWHLNVDSTTQGMMGMATMLGMSGGDTFQASTQGLSPGKHTFFAILVDNQHAPLNPPVVAQVDLVVQ